jgi:PPK2 family polyphosphate:nucleotide phosphotransferase
MKKKRTRQRSLAEQLVAPPGKKIRLATFSPGWTGHLSDKATAQRELEDGIAQLAAHQDRLYAQDTYALLIIFQAMDAAGKDSTIRHVMSGINPQGCQVYSFKAPSPEEIDHGYLWRSSKALPERGRIGIHNRSYYEEVLVVRVRPEILAAQHLPAAIKTGRRLWQQRFAQINDFERYLVENGTVVLKFYLNVSQEEQRERFLERIDNPDKNWKFSANDALERPRWKEYMRAYEDMFTHTSTPWAPWYIVPADHKWFTRVAVASIINETLASLKLRYPRLDEKGVRALSAAKRTLMREK